MSDCWRRRVEPERQAHPAGSRARSCVHWNFTIPGVISAVGIGERPTCFMSEMSSHAWQRSGIAPPPAISRTSRAVQLLIIPLGGFVVLATAPWWASALLLNDFDKDWTGLFLVPLFLLVSLALAFRVSRGDSVLRWVLPVGIVLKVAAAGANLYIFGQVSADFVSYYGSGEALARQFQATGDLALYQPLWSSNFIRNLTGCLFILTGPCMSAAMVLFAFVGLWGQYFFYRAFCVAFPDGDRRFAGLTLFLLPSVVFWPASVGKDAPMLLFIGLSVYGFAHILRRPRARFLLLCGLGLLGAAMVRPHIAALIVMAFLTAYLVGRNLSGVAGTLRKFLLVPVLLAATFYLVSQARSFVDLGDISGAQDVLQRIARNSQVGGSAFSAGSTATGLLAAPLLLFRPFPWEIGNAQSAAAALEGTGLLFLLWRRRRAFWAALRNYRANPFVLFILVYTSQVLLLFSVAINNLGLLVRQRVMVVPFVMMLMCTGLSAAHARALQTAPGSARPVDVRARRA